MSFLGRWLVIVFYISMSSGFGHANEEALSYLFPERSSDRSGIRTNVLIVLKDNKIVFEKYADGFFSHKPYLLWSMSKSFTNVLIGIAHQESLVKLDDVIFTSDSSEIKLRDALWWKSCLDWNETYEFNPIYSSVIRMLYSIGRDDMFSFVKSHKLRCQPGSEVQYSSGDSLLLMGYLKQKLSDEKYSQYPWKKLFEPLAMYSAVWEKDSKGVFVGSSFLYLSPKDLVSFSNWLLSQYQSGELSAWLRDSTKPSPAFDRKTKEQGLWPAAHWWVNGDAQSQRFSSLPSDLFAALGHWGQSLTFIPSKNIVILRLADDRESGVFDYERMVNIILKEFQ